MSRFYGEIRGNRGITNRMGTTKSGFYAHVRGWNVGIELILRVNSKGKDEIDIYKTSGSNCTKQSILIKTIKEGK